MKTKHVLILLICVFQITDLSAQLFTHGNQSVSPQSNNSAIGRDNTIDPHSDDCTAIGEYHKINNSFFSVVGGSSNTVIDNSHGCTAFGGNCTVGGNESFAVGSWATASQNNSVAIGWNIRATAANAYTIGSGDWWRNTGPLENRTENSIIMGVNSTTPAICIAGAVGGNSIAHVGIGLQPFDPKLYDHTFCVNGDIIAERVKVKLYVNWPDYVFSKEYKPRSLSDLEEYINENSHLPDIADKETLEKDGYDLNEMDAKLLQKVEELTLYMIELKKENDNLRSEVSSIKKSMK